MLAVGIPFVAFANLVLFHFYVRGSFVLDSGLLASLLVDNSIAALAPNGFAREEVPFLQGNETAPSGATTAADTVIFFAEGYDARRLRAVADAAGLTNRYSVPGTQVRLAVRQRLEEVPSEQGDLQQ